METSPRILICDDEPLISSSIKNLLEFGSSYQIQTVNNPLEALRLIHENPPDLVIIDVMMPEMTGFQVLDAVNRNIIDTAFIFITGETSIDAAIQAIRKGASDFLRKPFDPEELIIRVRKVLQQRQMRIENVRMEIEKQQLESQLRHSHKMEAIGSLTGGIAHDFNNVLSIIIGNTELAQLCLQKDQAAYPFVDQIHSASMRAKDMIRQLLNFSRKEETDLQPVTLNATVLDSLTLMRASLPSNIVIERDITDTLCTTLADVTQIHQIVYNLCTNSAHAMEVDGGTLTIRLSAVTLEADRAIEIGVKPGNYAHLVVSDTGKGIPHEVMGRIFDPYFTTKETGKGTGLGLSVVHGIVKRYGGGIKVASVLNSHTEFHLYFPSIDKQVAVQKEPSQKHKLPGGQERILIVDDENMLVGLWQNMLEQLGYKVTAFTNSAHALTAFRVTPDAFDIMITDMTMPHLSGVDLIRAVKEVRPELPVVLCTGYNKLISEANAHTLGIRQVVMKPFGIETLAKVIRQNLLPERDRRRIPRFRAAEGVYAISQSSPDKRIPVLDFGIAGVACKHGMEPAMDNATDLISIVADNGKFFIPNLLCRNVSRIAVTGTGSAYTRRGLAFENPSLNQLDMLTQLIQKFSAPEETSNSADEPAPRLQMTA
ncbi:MAG: response regulator [Pseudomonadota bacterium]